MNCEHGEFTKGRCRKRASHAQGIPLMAKSIGPNGDRQVILGYKAKFLCPIHAEGKELIVTIEEFNANQEERRK